MTASDETRPHANDPAIEAEEFYAVYINGNYYSWAFDIESGGLQDVVVEAARAALEEALETAAPVRFTIEVGRLKATAAGPLIGPVEAETGDEES